MFFTSLKLLYIYSMMNWIGGEYDGCANITIGIDLAMDIFTKIKN